VTQATTLLDLSGEGIFSFKIPNTTTSLLSTIAFNVKYEDTVQSYGKTLLVTQNDKMVIDFYTETQSSLVTSVTNKVFFQAWATEERADLYEINGAKLVATLSSGKN
jgi:hypothetical protein